MSVEITGMKALQKKLKRLPPKLQRSVVRKAVNAGSQEIVKAARREAPVRSKNLKRALGKKVKTDKTKQHITAEIGARRGKNGAHLHLVHEGVRAHLFGVGKLLRIGNNVFMGPIQHPGSRPNPFLKRAFDNNHTTALSAMVRKMRTTLEPEAKRA